jgi:phage shock protein A
MFEREIGRMLARCKRILQRQIASPEPPDEDPEMLLQEAQEQMRALHAKNRERAVEAITQKNNLQFMVEDTRRRLEHLRLKAEEAEQTGNLEKAVQCRSEAGQYEQTLVLTEAQLAQAIETAEAVKTAIKSEEERIRQKTAEALALKAQWKSVQIEQTISRRLAEISSGISGKTSAEFRAQHERNRQALAEAIQVRNELQQMVEQTARKVAELKVKANFARQREDETLERTLLREMEQHEAVLLSTRDALDRAEMMTDRAKVLFQEEEERLASLPPDSMETRPLSPTPDDTDTTEGTESGVAPLLLALALVVLLVIVAFLLR